MATPVEAAESAEAATWPEYMKYFTFHVIALLSVVALLAGGVFLTAGLLAVVAIYVIGDAIGGDDTSTPKFLHPGVLTAQLWMALPLLSLIVFSAVWNVSPGDPLGFGAWITRWTGYDVIAARDATTFVQHVSAWIVTGLMIGLVGTIPANELTHRTWDRVSMLVGRWLLAFSFDTTFAIEHVYGHHRYVSAPRMTRRRRLKAGTSTSTSSRPPSRATSAPGTSSWIVSARSALVGTPGTTRSSGATS